MRILQTILVVVTIAAFLYVIIQYTVRLAQLVFAAVHLNKRVKKGRYSDHGRFVSSDNMVPVSLLVPVYNGAQTVVHTVRNLLSLNFPEYEIIVINDGSLDNTLLLLKLEYELVKVQQPFRRVLQASDITAIYRSPLYAGLIVVDKPHGGKADTLNAGINISNYPVYAVIDSDTILEKNSLTKLIMPFVNSYKTAFVGGIVRVASEWTLEKRLIKGMNITQSFSVYLQTIEYIRTFLSGRVGIDPLGMLLIVSGSFGAFNKNAVVDVGGYSREAIGVDMDLVLRLHTATVEKNRTYGIDFLEEPVCCTKAPDTYGQTVKQRMHWHTELMDVLKKRKDLLFNKRYKQLGKVSMPYYWFFEYIYPVAEAALYVSLLLCWLTGAIPGLVALSIFLMVALYSTILSMGALLLEEQSIQTTSSFREMIKLVLTAMVENLGYRQINCFACVVAMLRYKKSKVKFRKANAIHGRLIDPPAKRVSAPAKKATPRKASKKQQPPQKAAASRISVAPAKGRAPVNAANSPGTSAPQKKAIVPAVQKKSSDDKVPNSAAAPKRGAASAGANAANTPAAGHGAKGDSGHGRTQQEHAGYAYKENPVTITQTQLEDHTPVYAARASQLSQEEIESILDDQLSMLFESSPQDDLVEAVPCEEDLERLEDDKLDMLLLGSDRNIFGENE
ncbi:MAG: glycosyltransferase [Clostridiales bacterium]|jgi:cellulose synthase/poly-beta-1,6-N-acetylglucosamine synthase-like glycosyltransferase|nr:glycosyltransferase [Clostridiales bacterium]